MTPRPIFRLLLPLALLLLALASTAGAATRPPSDGQLRAAVGKLLPPSAALTDVSSDYQLSQGTRLVVVEFRPEDRGGAAAISRSTYDAADPLPINGLVLQATRSAAGVLTYSMTAVSESQKRFYIRGQISGGRQGYLQLLSLDLQQQLTAAAPEVEAWFNGLQFSDSAYRVTAGSFLSPASNSNVVKTIGLLTGFYKTYRFCTKIPFLRSKCKSWLRSKSEGVINLAFPWREADAINGALHSCSVRQLRRVWRQATGYNPPPVLLQINKAVRVERCSA